MSQDPKKPVFRAVAIRHERDTKNAPEVVAKGSGEIALKIIEIAEQNGIPLHADPDLVGVLAHLEVHDRISPEMYRAVAEILAFLYRINAQYKQTP